MFYKDYCYLRDIKRIIVVNNGESFTSLRLGVVAANALAFALQIPILVEEKRGKIKKVKQAEPVYSREPNIG